LGNVSAYEMIKAKCKVEEVSRRYGQVNKRMPVWKDLGAMLTYRVVDAAFQKIFPFTMLTDDEMHVIGFATLLHDMVDFGYDVSVKESSNIFLTITNGKVDLESAKKGYARMANGLQYVLGKYKYDACGLTFLSTHYWQMSNGRHRVIPNIYNGATDYHHQYLDFKSANMLDVLNEDNKFETKVSKSATEYAQDIRDTAKSLGEDAIALADLVTVVIYSKYATNEEVDTNEILIIERKMCELGLSNIIGGDVDGKMTDYLWMILEFMWLKTGMSLSCLLGTLQIMGNRRQSDDRGGLDYVW